MVFRYLKDSSIVKITVNSIVTVDLRINIRIVICQLYLTPIAEISANREQFVLRVMFTASAAETLHRIELLCVDDWVVFPLNVYVRLIGDAWLHLFSDKDLQIVDVPPKEAILFLELEIFGFYYEMLLLSIINVRFLLNLFNHVVKVHLLKNPHNSFFYFLDILYFIVDVSYILSNFLEIYIIYRWVLRQTLHNQLLNFLLGHSSSLLDIAKNIFEKV